MLCRSPFILLWGNFHRCFPPNFSSFGQAISEEKNFKNQPTTSPTPGASNFHIWANWNNQLYARRASKKIYRILTNLSIFVYLLIFIYRICYMLFNVLSNVADFTVSLFLLSLLKAKLYYQLSLSIRKSNVHFNKCNVSLAVNKTNKHLNVVMLKHGPN
jgi:hypothetical protein